MLQSLSENLFPSIHIYIVIKCHCLPNQDGQPCLKNSPLKIVSLISKALSAIFWPNDMRLKIRKCIEISALFYQLQIRQFSVAVRISYISLRQIMFMSDL